MNKAEQKLVDDGHEIFYNSIDDKWQCASTCLKCHPITRTHCLSEGCNGIMTLVKFVYPVYEYKCDTCKVEFHLS